jgi:histidine triad (HIT) family protein
MDIFPQSRGHWLVIPKNVQARNFLDLPSEVVGDVFGETQRIAKAMEKALQCDGIVATQFSGAEAGQTGSYLGLVSDSHVEWLMKSRTCRV